MVWTARVDYQGPDRFDVTRKTGQEGLFLAPTWEAIRPVLDARRKAEEALRGAHRDGAIGAYHRAVAAETLEAAWSAYHPAFVALMRASWQEHRVAWLRLLARESVTLVCYCTEVERCHRTILARELLPKVGATYQGERGTLALPWASVPPIRGMKHLGTCSVCGKPQFETPSGPCCENGHGGAPTIEEP